MQPFFTLAAYRLTAIATAAIAAAEATTVTTAETASATAAAKATTATAVCHAVYAGAHRVWLTTAIAARSAVARMAHLCAQVCIITRGLIFITATALAITKLT